MIGTELRPMTIIHHPWRDTDACYIGPDGATVHVGHATALDVWPVLVGVALGDSDDGLEVRLSIDWGITIKTARLCPEDAVTLAAVLTRHTDAAECCCAAAV